MKRFFIFLMAFLLIFFYACDIVDKPYTEQADQCGHDNLSVPIKKVLIEDYTGHLCGNCPQAHAILQDLKNRYCDHIVPVSIHVGFFARPVSGDYSTDFRTPAGNTYNEYFGNDAAGLPNGLVNRAQYNGTLILSPQAWGAALQAQLDKPLLLDVQVDNQYDVAKRQVTATVNINFIQKVQGPLTLTLWVVEDSIVDYQKDYYSTPQDIPDYVHRHVLRYCVTDPWGDEIISSQAAPNQTITKKYVFNLDTAWVDRHCHVVAFVSYKDSREVLQAEDEKIFK